MAMQVILREDVTNLGKSGDLVKVKPGYGRNYLIPQGLAMLATKANIAQIEHHKKQIAAAFPDFPKPILGAAVAKRDITACFETVRDLTTVFPVPKEVCKFRRCVGDDLR